MIRAPNVIRPAPKDSAMRTSVAPAQARRCIPFDSQHSGFPANDTTVVTPQA
jgi:hypothetical protein